MHSRAKEATVYLTKLAAARRQLDAAIRLVFLDEDVLAIHTIAAAAYHIIKDLKAKRGQREFSDTNMRGIFYVARDLATGDLKLDEIPPEIRQNKKFIGVLLGIADRITSGEVKNLSQLVLQSNSNEEQNHWRNFNAAANFLKHADKDHAVTLPESQVENETLFLRVIPAYFDLMGNISAEMYLYYLKWLVDHDQNEFRNAKIFLMLKEMDFDKRGRFCLQVLAEGRVRGLDDKTLINDWASEFPFDTD